jgi:hypothetical protein
VALGFCLLAAPLTVEGQQMGKSYAMPRP